MVKMLIPISGKVLQLDCRQRRTYYLSH